eukprot:SAG31_NODE_5231_length_2659_cov_37.454297_3_plen_110_part_00
MQCTPLRSVLNSSSLIARAQRALESAMANASKLPDSSDVDAVRHSLRELAEDLEVLRTRHHMMYTIKYMAKDGVIPSARGHKRKLDERVGTTEPCFDRAGHPVENYGEE